MSTGIGDGGGGRFCVVGSVFGSTGAPFGTYDINPGGSALSGRGICGDRSGGRAWNVLGKIWTSDDRIVSISFE